MRVFHDIWSLYYKKIVWYISGIIGVDYETSQDLAQEVMFKIYDKMDKYNDTFKISTWIYTIARNHSYDYLRKNKNKIKVVDPDKEYSTSKTPYDMAVQKEINNKIDKYLLSKDELNREIAYFRFYENMKLKNIAKIVDIPLGSVKSKLSSIKSELRKVLEGYNEHS